MARWLGGCSDTIGHVSDAGQGGEGTGWAAWPK